MNFEKKQFQTILRQMLSEAVVDGVLSNSTDYLELILNGEDCENFLVLLMSVFSKTFERLYEDEELVYNSFKLSKAEGPDLDDIGSWLGIRRPEETKAYCLLTFELDEPVEEITRIPKGVIVSTDDGIHYETVENLTFYPDSYEAYSPAFSVDYGPSQRVNAFTLNKILTDLSLYITREVTCTNYRSATGGTSAYDDEQYRELLLNWRETHQRGNLQSIREVLDNYQGLDSYRLAPCWDGSGTLKIIIDCGDDGSEYHINELMNELQKTAILRDDDITIVAAEKKELTLNININVDIDVLQPLSRLEKDKIAVKVMEAARVFVNGGRIDDKYSTGLTIGEDFIPHKLAVFLDSMIPEIKNIKVLHPNIPVTISDEEIAYSNFINVEVV